MIDSYDINYVKGDSILILFEIILLYKLINFLYCRNRIA